MGARFNKLYLALVVQNVRRGHLFFWAASGPLCLFAAFAFLLFRASWELWPFILLASSGLFSVFLFRRRGFYASFLALVGLSVIEYPIVLEQPWCALFLAATVFSWGIVLLGQEEIDQWFDVEMKKNEALEELNRQLHEQIEQACKEAKPFDEEFKAALCSRNAAIESQHRAYEEIDKLRQQYEALNQEIASYQSKEKAFQAALDDAQAQVIRYKYAEPLKAYQVVNPIIPQEISEEKGEEPAEMRQLQYQHSQLRAQFEEKAEALNLARKELFYLEGQLLLLQKESEENNRGDQAMTTHQLAFQTLMERCQHLEEETQSLEEIISTLTTKKKAATPRKPRTKKPLSTLLQKAVDQSSNQYSLLD